MKILFSLQGVGSFLCGCAVCKQVWLEPKWDGQTVSLWALLWRKSYSLHVIKWMSIKWKSIKILGSHLCASRKVLRCSCVKRESLGNSGPSLRKISILSVLCWWYELWGTITSSLGATCEEHKSRSHSNRLLQKFHKLLVMIPLQKSIKCSWSLRARYHIIFFTCGWKSGSDISSFVYLVPNSKVLTTTLVFSPLNPIFHTPCAISLFSSFWSISYSSLKAQLTSGSCKSLPWQLTVHSGCPAHWAPTPVKDPHPSLGIHVEPHF